MTTPSSTDLSDAEIEQAKRAGMTAEKFAGLKDVRTYDEWQALRKRLAEAE